MSRRELHKSSPNSFSKNASPPFMAENVLSCCEWSRAPTGQHILPHAGKASRGKNHTQLDTMRWVCAHSESVCAVAKTGSIGLGPTVPYGVGRCAVGINIRRRSAAFNDLQQRA